MASNNTVSPSLYDRITRRAPLHRALDLIILFLLVSLLVCRFLHLNSHGFAWLLALLCESWFVFLWLITVSTKWNPVQYKTYPERLSQRIKELPPVDMFVTTADPGLEPPIITVDTVLSLFALDYPADKLACYISDDGCSPLTYFSLVEATEFAKRWVPFCRKYSIQVRAPYKYFYGKCGPPGGDDSIEFQNEHKRMKEEYEELSQKIEVASRKSTWDLTGDLAVFSNTERKNHHSIIKVIYENKEGSNGLPHLIYVSREKRPRHPHNYKAGAMNVLVRVSGMMTNAPFILNVDCDVYVNNPEIIGHAMCLLLGCKSERECAFVQSPHFFYDGLNDDPFGNQLKAVQEYILRGMVGIQGPVYGGSECFHRRKVIYGLCPHEIREKAKKLTPVYGNLENNELLKIFGNLQEFIASVIEALQGKISSPRCISHLVDMASKVAGCDYESNTCWGKEIGWHYGSQTEDVFTGMMIHNRGWGSLYCSPDPIAFLGYAPFGGPKAMTQQKRWATGLLEILVSRKGPIISTINGELKFRQCLGYMWFQVYALRSIPELCYMVLPAYCIITNDIFLPKDELAKFICGALFVIYTLYTLLEYLRAGLSIRSWWNNQRMAKIISISAWFFAILCVILKILGISDTVFEVTQKEESTSNDDAKADRFTFDGSSIFVPGTTLLLVHLTALVVGLLRLQTLVNNVDGPGLGEMMGCVLVVILLWPFFKGLFGKGKYGIPLSTILKSALLTAFLVNLCRVYRFQWSSCVPFYAFSTSPCLFISKHQHRQRDFSLMVRQNIFDT